MTLADNPRSLVFYLAYPGPGNLDGASRSLVDPEYVLKGLEAVLEDDSFEAIELTSLKSKELQGKVAETLRLMGRPTSERITRDVASELCTRTGSKAVLVGSISKLGNEYVVGIDAVGCSSGDTLAEEQEGAASKEEVLKALSKAAASLRGKLGESLASVQKFDVPIEATTTSLEALKAFSMGVTAGSTKGHAAAIPFLKRALELDPKHCGMLCAW